MRRAVPVTGEPGWYRQGYHLLDSLPALKEDPRRGLKFELPPSGVILPVSHRSLDHIVSRELVMRKLLRGVTYRSPDRSEQTGRLVLASEETTLVAGPLPPTTGTLAPMALQTPEGSGQPPLRFVGLVERSGPRLVAGGESGFIASIRTFWTPADERRWMELVGWLLNRKA
jgi:hypothetical protein